MRYTMLLIEMVRVIIIIGLSEQFYSIDLFEIIIIQIMQLVYRIIFN